MILIDRAKNEVGGGQIVPAIRPATERVTASARLRRKRVDTCPRIELDQLRSARRLTNSCLLNGDPIEPVGSQIPPEQTSG
jgi:hypothetical protein